MDSTAYILHIHNIMLPFTNILLAEKEPLGRLREFFLSNGLLDLSLCEPNKLVILVYKSARNVNDYIFHFTVKANQKIIYFTSPGQQDTALRLCRSLFGVLFVSESSISEAVTVT